MVCDVHPNESLVREAYSAMAAGDGRTLAKMLTPDTTWVICGKGGLAGSYQGPDKIFGLWKGIAEQTNGGLQLELQDVLANEARAVAIVVARGERNGRVLDERQLAHFEFSADGKVQTARFIYEDPDAYDAFWTS